MLAQAVRLHQAGRLAEAASLLRQLLAIESKQIEALNLLGAISILQGDLAEAMRLLNRSLRLQPSQPHALNYLGYARHRAGEYEGALAAYNRAIAMKPDFAEAYCNRGLTLRQLSRVDDALASYDRAIMLSPALAHAHYHRAVVLHDLDRLAEAVAGYEKTVDLEPRYVEAHNDLATALLELGRFEEALRCVDRALAINPGLFGALVNRGNILNQLQRFDQALETYGRALAINPKSAQVYSNRGHLLHDAGRYQEALENYDQALRLEPDLALVQWNKGLIKLLSGQFEEGWPLYESRWQSYASQARRDFPQPLWLGHAPLHGKTILLHAEQGFGDTIQFCRYLPAVRSLGAQIVLEAPAELLPLLRSLPGEFVTVAAGADLPQFDCHCPLLSLPLALGTTVETIPGEVPYLGVDPLKRDEWSKRLGPKLRPRVGLAWAGSARHLIDRERSVPLDRLVPLLRLNCEFHSLQKELRTEDRTLLDGLTDVRLHDGALQDFGDTAALVEAMDLVISVDTAIAHVAGALARRVWLMLPHAPDFRWMLERRDSPWYPTAVLFRQTSRGGWDGVIEEIVRQLNLELPSAPVAELVAPGVVA
ncbi:MAG: tetratricopeptide repeat protein [Nevskia sp.]|nr:tetratricopeptide repeat protein [Nevskia sp.]